MDSYEDSLRCQGCGRIDPMGVHYDDCSLLDEEPITTLVIPREDAGTVRDDEQFAIDRDAQTRAEHNEDDAHDADDSELRHYYGGNDK